MLRVGVLVSGGGTNLQAILDAIDSGALQNTSIECVISSRPDAYALERAKSHHIATGCLRRRDFESQQAYDTALVDKLRQYGVELVVLAGFMTIIGETVVRAFPNRIINVHPALIPSFCGKGFYGLHVHEEALRYGVKVTGATVHFVNNVCDGGPIILQHAVEVREGDTPEVLQRRVMEEAEWKLLPKAVALFCEGRLSVEGGTVHIREE